MTQATLNVIDYYISNDFCRGGNGEDERQLLEERRLIAAAPAMLAALERIVHTELIGGSAISMRMTASNAIARAKGLDQ